MDGSIVIRNVASGDADSLGAFFAAVVEDAATVAFFHPHPLTAEYATALCARDPALKDVYISAFEGATLVAYGMLRGWDEGFEVPAFGVCVHPERRGEGLAKRVLDYAIAEATAAGSPAIMLKVYASNRSARVLYERTGFVFEDGPADGKQLIGRLPLKGGGRS